MTNSLTTVAVLKGIFKYIVIFAAMQKATHIFSGKIINIFAIF